MRGRSDAGRTQRIVELAGVPGAVIALARDFGRGVHTPADGFPPGRAAGDVVVDVRGDGVARSYCGAAPAMGSRSFSRRRLSRFRDDEHPRPGIRRIRGLARGGGGARGHLRADRRPATRARHGECLGAALSGPVAGQVLSSPEPPMSQTCSRRFWRRTAASRRRAGSARAPARRGESARDRRCGPARRGSRDSPVARPTPHISRVAAAQGRPVRACCRRSR